MKESKKALADSIATVVREKLSGSGEQSNKAIKAIEKASKKLAIKLGKISSKEKKKLKQAKKEQQKASDPGNVELKKLKEVSLKPVHSPEGNLISIP